MKSKIDQRLSRLSSRRRGIDRMGQLSETAQLQVLAKIFKDEIYETRAQNRPHTKYALGSMQEVDSDYTRISREEAERIGNQLSDGLRRAGVAVAFRLQGSVPLNIHIKGVSDVDLLTLDVGFVTTDSTGWKSKAGGYVTIAGSPLQSLQYLRQEVEHILSESFPKADVDKSGRKAVKISGGSLRRPVDVVPAHWHDTAAYQLSDAEHDRGVKILDRSGPATILNMPFLHIKLLNERDALAGGGLKKAIRLCKNVKADAIEDGTAVDLPSFDIAALMYHADLHALRVSAEAELGILAEATRHLDSLARNLTYAATLRVPDGSRAILDTTAKQSALVRLSAEMDEVAQNVAVEQSQAVPAILNLPVVQDALRKSRIAA